MKGYARAASLLLALSLALFSGCHRVDAWLISDAPAPDGGGAEGPSSMGCANTAMLSGDTNQTIQVGNASRTYVLHVPAAYEAHRPAPLIVDFHAIGNTGTSELSNSPYPEVTDVEGVVMAFPDGLKGPAGTGWNVGPCCVGDVDDLAFSRALVADVQRKICVDAARIYAVGVSTGGGMAYMAACQQADLFAAAAPAAFDLLAENVDACRPSRPITVVSFRGTADVRVPYDGGPSSLVPGMPVTFLGAQATFERWATLDGCTDAPSSADRDGCVHHTACRDGTEVILCSAEGGRQAPGDARVAWPVLRRHDL